MALSAETTIGPGSKSLSFKFIAKVFIICLSFANLSFLNVWEELPGSQRGFFRRYAVTWQELAAVTLDVFLFAGLLWIPVCLVAKYGGRTWMRILRWCAFFGMLLPLNVIRISTEGSSLASIPVLQTPSIQMLIVVLGVSIGILLLWTWERFSAPVAFTALVLVAPGLTLFVLSVAWTIHTGPPAGRFPDKPSVGAVLHRPDSPHVLWFIFDEWDETLTFLHRPANLELPELDRFRGQSFHADRAYPPARVTMVSIPSLLAGKTFVRATPNGASQLLLTYDPNQPPERFTAESTIFSEARSGGFNVGIVGFYLPYCRLFDTTFCEWQCATGFLPVDWGYPISVGRFMLLSAKRQLLNVPFMNRLGVIRALGLKEGPTTLSSSLHAVTYHQTHDAVLKSIIDPRLNLVFVHWNVPHLPAIYDAAKDDFSNSTACSYLDNIRLVDRTVRDVRLILEKTGIWDSSTILMTTDHPLRFKRWGQMNWGRFRVPQTSNPTQTHEVPFLLKMAGQKREFAYNTPMQTVVTKDLLLAIMKGEITQPEQVAAWLDHNPPRQ